MIRHLFDSLVFRIAGLFLLGLLVLQGVILAVILWPDGRPVMFRLVDPVEVRRIVDAVEQAPPSLRPLIVAAVGNGGTVVELLPGFPDADNNDTLRDAPRMEARFRQYAEALSGRTVRVQVRDDDWRTSGDPVPRGPMRVLVGLSTGEVLAVERAPLLLQMLLTRYLYIALAAAVIVGLIMLTLLRQVVWPIERLARAADAFGENVDLQDAPVSGAREVRTLALALNLLKQRIGGLLAERTRMLAAIAHDMRTYLTRLRLRVDYLTDEKHRRRAINDLEEMGQLLDDILLFARTDAGAETGASLIDARAETADYVERRRETGDAVSLTVADTSIPCRCSPLAFRRILSNLVDNAVRYGTRADVELRAQAGQVLLTVSDDGPGVPPELIARLTAPFERLDASRGRRGGGAGLGLSIVKALAGIHGGHLTIVNGPTGGLRVTVGLPGQN
jgi:signal transduction histidine kinase